MNFTRFPRRSYLNGPTPIEALPNLSRALGNGVNIYIKRDDLLPGAAGGNKTRKLEFSMAEAIEKGADTIITCGAIQSNHCRLTASWAAKEGLDCYLILGEKEKGDFNKNSTGNIFLFDLLNANIKLVPGDSDMTFEMNQLAEELTAKGKKPYMIPIGASNAVGSLGYAACAEETMTQLNTMKLPIDYIILPSGSCGTQAGMVAGMVGLNAGIPVLGMNVLGTKPEQEQVVYNLAEELAEILNLKTGVDRKDVVCFDEYVGPGYALPTQAMVEAVRLFASKEAILLDPVYSGKTASGLIDLIRKEFFPKNASVLFLHTGGTPALYAYMDVFCKRGGNQTNNCDEP